METPGSTRASSPPQVTSTRTHLPGLPASTDRDSAADTAPFALARFEFETGKGNEGTKILMMEWDLSISPAFSAPGSDLSSPPTKSWDVSWGGKTNHLPASDDVKGTHKRVYFLLPPGAIVPPTVAITHPDGTALTIKPLPAIFPPGLAAGELDTGTRGVLHTIWAKKRLRELQQEIDAEKMTNAESVGLEMVLQEQQWVIDHFGLTPNDNAVGGRTTSASQILPSPISPHTPTGRRLGEKLKGLKLATSAADLIAGSADKNAHVRAISFSPAPNDMAVHSFSNPALEATTGNPLLGGSASLDAMLAGTGLHSRQQDQDQEEELFALPMSPRSPEMKRSPFSFA
ncbi:hypothetical protein BDP55DRAFT_698258 [Colletotrichum godetiae]|uniref:Uncharacterized protein n=1 Tax=Colletotrichum godetiae TaxID=1209918 RepID=A0AAJ0ENH5_9PEZI|nr:uncharacterized protein BDP55DRAFT_698258 [Colletotrichum godetiae]KAK1658576.1 hypothetical protein BDP55DRAFT_698258 [Colletotrichum godetiae]